MKKEMQSNLETALNDYNEIAVRYGFNQLYYNDNNNTIEEVETGYTYTLDELSILIDDLKHEHPKYTFHLQKALETIRKDF